MLQKLKSLEANHSYVEKTSYDFSLALSSCYSNSTAPYIALFEGDIVAADGWFARMKLALKDATAVSTKQNQDWLDLRLFNDAKEIRWTARRFGRSNIPILAMAMPIVIASLSGLVYIALRLSRKRSGSAMLSEQAIRTICLFTIPAFVILFFQVGYLSTIPRPTGVRVQPWGCCTQGIIFPRARVPELIEKLQERASHTPADITIWNHAADQHLLRLVLDPAMVQHVGFSSVLDPERKKDKAVWSVDFEDLDPGVLAEEHEKMVLELY
jgi:hypothetical protein